MLQRQCLAILQVAHSIFDTLRQILGPICTASFVNYQTIPWHLQKSSEFCVMSTAVISIIQKGETPAWVM